MGNCEQCGQELPEDFFTELVFNAQNVKQNMQKGKNAPNANGEEN